MTYRYLTKILSLFFAVSFIVIVSFIHLVNAGGTYYISHWDEEIVINEEASLAISENITFCFVSGDFGYAYRTIPHRGFDDMISISVTDDEGNSLEYSLSRGSIFEVRWEWERIYVGSEPIEKTFALTYTLTNAMNYENPDPDRDRLYWNIVTDCVVAIHDMNIDVSLPSIYSPNSISASSYYSISSTNPPEMTNSTTHTIVSYHQPVVEAEEDYTLDIYFPATVERPPPTLTETIKVHLDLVAPWYSIGMIVVGIVALVKVRSFKKRFRDPEISILDVSGVQPPAEVRPPEAGVLSDMDVGRKHFDSTILDLAQRGYLNMRVESKETGFFRKRVKVESFEVTLSEKGKNALQSEDPDLKRYEWSLLKGVDVAPLKKKELSRITKRDAKKKFGLEVIKDELVEGGLVEPRGFEKKGTNLMILGVVLALLGFTVVIFHVFVGSENWWMSLTAFFPAIVFGLARTTGPRTVRGAALSRQTRDFLEKMMRELKERGRSSPLLAMQQINKLAPWLVLHRKFYQLLSAPNNAMKDARFDATGDQQMDVLPSYIEVVGSGRETMSPLYYSYWIWFSFYSTASPSTGTPPGGGGAGGGGAGGGGGGGGAGAG